MNGLSQEFLTWLFDDLSDGVCLSDSDFRVLYLNPAAERMTGVTAAQTERATICELMSVALPTPGLRACVENCPLRDKSSTQAAITHALKGLRIRCLRMRGEWLDGRPGYLTLIEDDSAQVELERHKEDWRHMIAHDLRAPLTVIMGTLGALAEAPEGEALAGELKRLVELSRRSGDRMLELLNLYLDIAKLDAGLMPVELQPIDLGALAAEVVEEQAPGAAARGLRMSLDVPQGLLALADRGLLARVIQNLIENAIKYNVEGGAVAVTGRAASDGQVSLSVKDTGRGIAPEDMPFVYDRFYQAKARREGRVQGTGLGLTFCQQAMQAMRGSLFALSEPGQGTEFTIRCPSALATDRA